MTERGRWAVVFVLLGVLLAAAGAQAGGGLTPGLAAGGVPLTATVAKVEGLLGKPSGLFQDPTNPQIYIERWEALCLGARYTPEGAVLALDVWADGGDYCAAVGGTYAVAGPAGPAINFQSTRADVKRAFGPRPDRVLRAGQFSVLVYDSAGVGFYIREAGERRDRVDTITIFPRHTSPAVWAPRSWAGR